MSNPAARQYDPDFASPPGETLLELLETQGITQAELAERTGRPKQLINEIVAGKASLSPETAIQLERALGVSASFWNSREGRFREFLARRAEQKRLETQAAWLGQFPLRQMIRWKWIPERERAVDQVRDLLNFFGVASPEQWRELWGSRRFAFRKSKAFRSDLGALSAWLRRGELEGREAACEPYDGRTFREKLRELVALTRTGDPRVFVPSLRETCAAAGVVVAFVPELSGCRASGVTQWLTPEKALIQLSLRYRTDDRLWFTFFHEAGHILLHGKKEIFVEGEWYESEEERQADRFAAEALLPAATLKALPNARFLSKSRIRQFAEESGVSPGIVVGRLQYEGLLPQTHYNDLKRRFQFRQSERSP